MHHTKIYNTRLNNVKKFWSERWILYLDLKEKSEDWDFVYRYYDSYQF